jgi:hypothetical protein
MSSLVVLVLKIAMQTDMLHRSKSMCLGAIAKSSKATIWFFISVRLSVRLHGTTRSHCKDFHEIGFLSILRKPVQKIQVLLKFDKHNGYFTLRPIYIFDYISLDSPWYENGSGKRYTENQNTHFLRICSIGSPTRCTWIYMYTLFLCIFAVHVSGAICTHPQEHKLQNAVIGVCNGYGMLIHWSKYWLEHPHTFSTEE